MINKKTLTLLTLTLLSIMAMVFSLFVLWYLDVDSETISAQIGSTLRLGIPSGMVLIVLIWFGAGMDMLLARIQKKSTRILVSLGVYLILPGTLCVGLPALFILMFAGVFTNGWNADTGFGASLLLTLAIIPSATGFLIIYAGAGVSSLTRWAARRIWPETEIAS